MDNTKLIAQFKIFAIGHKISFKSNQTVARKVSNYFVQQIGQPDTIVRRIHLDHSRRPEIKTIISCNTQASIEQLLSIPEVHTIFTEHAAP